MGVPPFFCRHSARAGVLEGAPALFPAAMVQVKTDRQGRVASGPATTFAPAQEVPVGPYITATATNKATGDTSEFADKVAVGT